MTGAAGDVRPLTAVMAVEASVGVAAERKTCSVEPVVGRLEISVCKFWLVTGARLAAGMVKSREKSDVSP